MFAGVRRVVVVDDRSAASFPAVLMYPAAAEPAPVSLGPYTEELSEDAPIAGGEHPLVVVSHGTGGSHLAYRMLARLLAIRGYVVALPEHPGNNRNDNRLEGTVENLRNRPRHVSLTIDAVLADEPIGAHVARRRIAVIGHSMGGYTALAAAGGVPRFSAATPGPVDVEADRRIEALVLLAPATPWFLDDGALAELSIPILLYTAEHDPHTPLWHAEIVMNGVAERASLTHRHVPNAGHFSFLSPFPPAMSSPDFPPSVDPAGFDREAFQHTMAAEIAEFLNDAL